MEKEGEGSTHHHLIIPVYFVGGELSSTSHQQNTNTACEVVVSCLAGAIFQYSSIGPLSKVVENWVAFETHIPGTGERLFELFQVHQQIKPKKKHSQSCLLGIILGCGRCARIIPPKFIQTPTDIDVQLGLGLLLLSLTIVFRYCAYSNTRYAPPLIAQVCLYPLSISFITPICH